MTKSTGNLDVRILKELTSPGSFQWNFRESYSDMAKRLGVDAETVRVTLRRSLEMGLVEKWRLILNPELFSCRLAGMQFDVEDPERKRQLISQIGLIEGVVQMLDFHGSSLRVIAYFEDEPALRRKVELIKSLCGDKGEVSRWISKTPHCGLKLKKLDWRIVKSVMHDPRKDASVIATEIGASSRTANRRLRQMTRGNVAYLIPVRNVQRSKGTICSFLIFCSDEGREAIREFLRSRALRVDFIYDTNQEVFIVTLVVNNPSEGNQLHQEHTGIHHVREVKMGIMNDFIFVDEWLDEAVARKMAI